MPAGEFELVDAPTMDAEVRFLLRLSDSRILVYRLGFLLILLQIDRPDPSVLLKVKPSIPISGNNCHRSELFSPLLL